MSSQAKMGTDYSVPDRKFQSLQQCAGVDRAVCPHFG